MREPVNQSAGRAAAFGWVLSRRLRFGDRGRALGAYLLFAALAVAVLAVAAARLAARPPGQLAASS